MTWEARPLTPLEYEEWDRAVELCPNATLFHTTPWLIAGNTPFEIIGVFDGARLAGGFVAQYTTEHGDKKHGARSFLTPYSGQVTFTTGGKRSSEVTRGKTVAEAAIEFIKAEYRFANVRLSPHIRDVQPYLWAGLSAGIRYTYLVGLSSGDECWNNLDENHKRNLKKADRLGLIVHWDEDWQACVPLFRATRDEIEERAPILECYWKTLSAMNRCRTITVRDSKGNLISAQFIVWDRYRSYYLLGGYEESAERSQEARIASTRGIWEAMVFSRDNLGLTTLDLEGSMIPGVELFFRKFGGELTPFYTVRWEAGGRSESSRFRRAAKGLVNAFRHGGRD